MTSPNSSYDASNIQILEGLEAVRMRPGMYIGSTTSRGLHHLVWEIVDNAIDERLAGHGNEITITVTEDDVVEVIDEARGMPVDIHPKTGLPAVYSIVETLHAGGKFGGGGYKVSGGLHGVGASVTNALSEWFEVEVRRDGHVHHARWEQGKRVSDLKKLRKMDKGEKVGTTVRWKHDATIFDKDVAYSAHTIEQRIREKAHLVRGLKFRLTLPGKKVQIFQSKNGIADLVSELCEERKNIHPKPLFFASTDKQHKGKEYADTDVPVEIALQWSVADDERTFSFANIISTVDGGTHVTGLRAGLTRVLRDYAYEQKKLKKDKNETFDPRDVFGGLTAAVSVQLENPQFEGQTKGKLNNAEPQNTVRRFVVAVFSEWLHDKANEKLAKVILEHVLDNRDLRMKMTKISKSRKPTSIFEDSPLPGKLADCHDTSDVEEREIFIVEGDSAAGCFVGETEVRLASGKTMSFEQLASDWDNGITHFGYATTEGGNIRVVPLIHPRLTKQDAPLVEVELDNGEKIECTPCHRFRLRDGSYVRAEHLEPGTLLMAQEPRAEGDLLIGATRTGKSPAGAGALLELEGPVLMISAKLDLARYTGQSIADADIRVTAVRSLEKAADVYDLTVDQYHNFALASGCFVHNSGKSARDARYQAILPVRGKVLNVFSNTAAKAFANAEVEGILLALGGRKDLVGRRLVATLNDEMRRYGKVIMCSDADPDGAHINMLLLTVFYELFPQLIREGRLFMAMPPLYSIGLDAKGEKVVYAWTPEEREALIKKHKITNPERITRFKGLGEMPAEDLRDTTFDPETRKIMQITIEDATEAAETVALMMGNKVAPRREWLEELKTNEDED